MENNMIKIIIYYIINIKKEEVTLQDAIEFLEQEIGLFKQNKSLFKEFPKEHPIGELFAKFSSMKSNLYEDIINLSILKLSYYNAVYYNTTLKAEISREEVDELVATIINCNKGIEQLKDEYAENIYAMNELANRYSYANMDAQALKLYEEAASKGCISAKYSKMVLLGKKYYYGKEVSQDYKKAFELFSQVQEMNAQAKYYLSKMYLFGYGVEEDEKVSEKLIDEAVRRRNKEAIEFVFNYNANMVKLMQEFNLDKNCSKEIIKRLDSLNMEINNIMQKEDGIIDFQTRENKHYFIKVISKNDTYKIEIM